VLGIVIKNIKIGMIIGIAIGLFAGSLGSKKE
jgi:Na+/H+-dicarboxylate symporter